MITMQNVRKKYKDFELELSLEIPEGRITGFVGKNGAGKSTAIKLILGLVKPDAGKICVFGNEGGELPAAVKQKIGVSFLMLRHYGSHNFRQLSLLVANKPHPTVI